MEEADVKRAGEFEKHTKVIGMKLLGKMGYKGGGLGINEQGIAAPIKVKPRPGKKGIGYDDSEEAARPVLQEFDVKSIPCPSQSLVGHTRENLRSKRASKKEAYIKVEQLLARKQEKGMQTVKKIIDMRGPQVRILTNKENLSARDISRENDFQIPELQHKTELLVDIAEHNILKLSSNQRNEMDLWLLYRRKRRSCRRRHVTKSSSLETWRRFVISFVVAISFEDLQTRFPDEYTVCNLSWIAFSYALPLFVRMFQKWDPLQNPTHGTEVVSSWKKLLQGKDSSNLSSTDRVEANKRTAIIKPIPRTPPQRPTASRPKQTQEIRCLPSLLTLLK